MGPVQNPNAGPPLKNYEEFQDGSSRALHPAQGAQPAVQAGSSHDEAPEGSATGPWLVSAATSRSPGRPPPECLSRAQQRPLPPEGQRLQAGPRATWKPAPAPGQVGGQLSPPGPASLPAGLGWALCPFVPPCSLAGLSRQPCPLSGSGACRVWEACTWDPCRRGWGCALLQQCDEEYSCVLNGFIGISKTPGSGMA